MGYADNVPDNNAFILGERRLFNLSELLDALKSISSEEYMQYVGADFNYFSDWIFHCVNHADLADSLRKAKSQQEAIKVLESAISGKSTAITVVKNKIMSAIQPAKQKSEKKNDASMNPHKTNHPESHYEMLDSFDAPIKDAPGGAQSKDKPDEVLTGDTLEDVELLMKKISRNEGEIKDILWKHFAWDLAKEFMYGMAVGIIIGFILSKILLR